jgi:FkbM family methyltransferase
MKILRKLIKRFLERQGFRIVDNRDYFHIEPFLCRLLRKNSSFFFIQVGANDGVSFDPIYPFITKYSNSKVNIRGIAIEPMFDAYQQLCRNYSQLPDIITVNAAIHNSEKEMTLYMVDPMKLDQLPADCKGIASFDPDHHKKSGTPIECIVSEKVACISLNELLNRYKVTSVDLLQIDTEGYDSEIIINLDFKSFRPKIIRFEHGLQFGTMSREKFTEVIRVLNDNGYQVITEQNDATAYQPLFFE